MQGGYKFCIFLLIAAGNMNVSTNLAEQEQDCKREGKEKVERLTSKTLNEDKKPDRRWDGV